MIAPETDMSAQKSSYRFNRPALLALVLLCVALLLIFLRDTSSKPDRQQRGDTSELKPKGEKAIAPEAAAGSGKTTRRRSNPEASKAPSVRDWAAILDGKYSAEGLMDRVEATGRIYSTAELVELERVMRERAGSEWDPESLLYMIGIKVAEHYPDAFMQETIGTWMEDPAATAFADDLIKQSIVREISRGEQRGWQAIERIAKRSREEPTRHDLRYSILQPTLVAIGGQDPGQNLERVIELWTPDPKYPDEDLRNRVLKEAQRITEAKQNGQQDGGGGR